MADDGLPVALLRRGAVGINGENRRLRQPPHALERTRRISWHPSVEDLLKHFKIGFSRQSRAGENLFRLGCCEESLRTVVVEQRPQAEVIAKAPEPAPVSDDTSESSAQSTNRCGSVGAERSHQYVGRCSRRRPMACVRKERAQLAGVVECTAHDGAQVSVLRQRRIDQVRSAACSQEALAALPYAEPRASMRSRGEHASGQGAVERAGPALRSDHGCCAG